MASAPCLHYGSFLTWRILSALIPVHYAGKSYSLNSFRSACGKCFHYLIQILKGVCILCLVVAAVREPFNSVRYYVIRGKALTIRMFLQDFKWSGKISFCIITVVYFYITIKKNRGLVEMGKAVIRLQETLLGEDTIRKTKLKVKRLEWVFVFVGTALHLIIFLTHEAEYAYFSPNVYKNGRDWWPSTKLEPFLPLETYYVFGPGALVWLEQIILTLFSIYMYFGIQSIDNFRQFILMTDKVSPKTTQYLWDILYHTRLIFQTIENSFSNILLLHFINMELTIISFSPTFDAVSSGDAGLKRPLGPVFGTVMIGWYGLVLIALPVELATRCTRSMDKLLEAEHDFVISSSKGTNDRIREDCRDDVKLLLAVNFLRQKPPAVTVAEFCVVDRNFALSALGLFLTYLVVVREIINRSGEDICEGLRHCNTSWTSCT